MGVDLHVDGFAHKDTDSTCSAENKEHWVNYLTRRHVYGLHVMQIEYHGY